MEMVLDGG